MRCARSSFRCLELARSRCHPGSTPNSLAQPARLRRNIHSTSRRQAALTPSEVEKRIAEIPIERYRNFCIVAHVDHGKSTLSDRLLELTGTIEKGGNAQILDRLEVERARGITVKAQTSAMIHKHSDGKDYLLHLVDTPGHVDFRTEVSRTYSSCGGGLLVVDASQGVQAQTVANFFLAFAQGLALVPVLNKVDLPTADIERTKDQITDTFEIDASDAICVSAKSGLNVEAVLPTVVEHIPAPVGRRDLPLRILLVDSWYDNFRGVILLVRVFDGELKPGDTITSFASRKKFIAGEVGILLGITRVPQTVLRAGQVGYVFFNPGMKRMQDALPGDTFSHNSTINTIEPLPGFEEPRSMVFVSAFPVDPRDFEKLRLSLEELALNDRSINISKESSVALGAGFRLGFLGTLHCSVFEDRLRQEHGQSIILTPPSTLFKVIWQDESEEIFSSPEDFPEITSSQKRISEIQEPYVMITITVPEEYLGRVIELCEASRGEQVDISFFSAQQMVIKYDLPLANLVDDFFGKLKGSTKGYGNLEYEDRGFRKSSLQKLQLLVNKEPVDALARIVHSSDAQRLGRQWVTKFKEHVDRQYFQVIIQAVVGNKVLARESIAPFRKDVTAKLHAADKGRRQKLLENQKAGRKRLSMIGSVEIKQEAFQSFLSK